MLRRLHREWAVAISGPRALLLQAAHPVAFEAFYGHTGALDAPYERLERTARVMDTVYFGSRERAERATRRVRAMHRRAGVDRADLLLWVLASLADSALVAYERLVGSLSRDERDGYWQDMRVVGELFGIAPDDMPHDIEGFDAYVRLVVEGGHLEVSERARELAIGIVLRPPVPLHVRPLVELVNAVTVGLLPGEVRRMYGLGWDPARGLALRAGGLYAKRVLVPLLPGAVRRVPAARAA
jgi:uncharacterized protein (DUF2236 family)